MIDFLISRFGLNAETNVLDLGCGTGQMAIPLAASSIPVWAVDPNTEMLCEGINQAASEGSSGIWWQVGSDETLLELRLPALTLCVMGASFHWMDRPDVLQKLDGLLSNGGGVAVLGGAVNTWSDQQDNWETVVKETVQKFLGSERRAGRGTYQHPKKSHQDVLSESPFKNVEIHTFEEEGNITIDDIVGLQLSTSYASPSLLGDCMDEFVGSLRDRLQVLSPSGRFRFSRTFEVITAVR